ncbi:DUF6777 domain-containing protein [Streptomyces sp. NPDC058623]|uniref:DUF6777 domain-containing protein n=1 Tax=Streptomyces sp. NPDC058623 TaxID=3346563 RepID=UPI0036697E1D
MNDATAPMTPRHTSRRHLPTCTTLFALVGLLAAGCTGSPPEVTKGPAAESKEVQLQPVGAAGAAPFTASFATRESAPVQPPLPNRSGRGIRTIGAATPGLYGGTQRFGSCDVERQVGYLVADEARGRAFASVAGVEQAKLPEFLRGLTPVVLRADTRVTSHGYKGGHPEDFQAVLQAGTAVLVDEHGMPRVRCGCGNPLVAPRSASGSPVTKGDPWQGYQANQVVVVEPSARPLDNLLIVNLADNTWIERRTGDDGAQDKTPRVLPPYDPADGIPDGPAIPPGAASDPCTAPDPNSLERTKPPVSPTAPPAGPPSDVTGGLPGDGPYDAPSDVPFDVTEGAPGSPPSDPAAGAVPGEAPFDPSAGTPQAGPDEFTGGFADELAEDFDAGPTGSTSGLTQDPGAGTHAGPGPAETDDLTGDLSAGASLDLPPAPPGAVPGAPGAPGPLAEGSSGVPGTAPGGVPGEASAGVPADPFTDPAAGLPLAGPQAQLPGAGNATPCPPAADTPPGKPARPPVTPQAPGTPAPARPADPAPNAPGDVPSEPSEQGPADPALPGHPQDDALQDMLDPFLPDVPYDAPYDVPDPLTEGSDEAQYLESA